jgi:hypothetical protein
MEVNRFYSILFISYVLRREIHQNLRGLKERPLLLKLIKIEFKYSVRTAKKTGVAVTEISWLMLFRELIAVWSEKHIRNTEMHSVGKLQSYRLKAGSSLGFKGLMKAN